ncbi:MAG: thioredoxin-like domain-containing protein [Bacteroidota bacterium]
MSNKRYLFLSFCLLGFFISCKKVHKGFKLSATLTGFSDSTMFFLKSLETDEILDSSILINNQFELAGQLSYASPLMLYSLELQGNKFAFTNLIMGNEEVELWGDLEDFPWNVKTKGSPTQDIAEQYYQIVQTKNEGINNLNAELNSLPDSLRVIEQNRISQRIQAINDSANDLSVDFIKTHFNSYPALIEFKRFKKSFDQDTLKVLYENLPEELKQSPYAQAVKVQLDFPPLEKGSKFYDIEAWNKEGNLYKLSSIQDKYILIHFSAYACSPSKLSIPEQRSLLKRYKDSLTIVNFSMDASKQNWEKMIERDTINWLSLWDGKGEYSPPVSKYRIIGMPNFVLISPQKKVINTWFGYEKGLIERNLCDAFSCRLE